MSRILDALKVSSNERSKEQRRFSAKIGKVSIDVSFGTGIPPVEEQGAPWPERVDEIGRAREALLDLFNNDPTPKGAFEAKVMLRGMADHGALGLALSDLIEEGIFVRNEDGKIVLAPLPITTEEIVSPLSN